MKKLFVLALAVLFSSIAFAASPTQVMTLMSAEGNSVRTRSLDNLGTLTDSVCKSSSRGNAALHQCVTQTAKLTKKEAAAMYEYMNVAQAALMSSDGESVSKSSSEGSGYANSNSDVMSNVGTTMGGHSSSMNGISVGYSLSKSNAMSQSVSSGVSRTMNDSHIKNANKAIGQSLSIDTKHVN
jgi:hypothetical protein